MTDPQKKIAVFRLGNLGDTVLALPALSAVRKRFPSDRIILIASKNRMGTVNASDVLSRRNLVDEVIEYDPEAGGLSRWTEFLLLRNVIKKKKIDTLIYLPPSFRKEKQVRRDAFFFRACGIRTLYGMDSFKELQVRDREGRLVRLPSESALTLGQLEAAGLLKESVNIPEVFKGLIRAEERTAIDRVLSGPGQKRVAFGVGGKAPAQRWPLERFSELGLRLIKEWDIEPVLFGALNDKAPADQLVRAWKRGKNLCGDLSVWESFEGLRRCGLYIGNDTGTMHLAAFAGTPCVAIFSARSNPGLWEPVGEGHTVLRKTVPCEGCELKVCNVEGHPCLNGISVEDVLLAAKKYLGRR